MPETITITITLHKPHLKAEVKVWFDQLFTEQYKFSIIPINRAIQHLDIKDFKNSRLYNYLNSLHSTYYSKMTPETFSAIKKICYGIIGDTIEEANPVKENNRVEVYWNDDEFV